jgi:DNA-binding transcriptional LysR family regulator
VGAPDEAAGSIVRVLPQVEMRGGGAVYVVYPSSAHVPARVTAFRDFVVEAFNARLKACQKAERRRPRDERGA